jgi:hypothetical protein
LKTFRSTTLQARVLKSPGTITQYRLRGVEGGSSSGGLTTMRFGIPAYGRLEETGPIYYYIVQIEGSRLQNLPARKGKQLSGQSGRIPGLIAYFLKPLTEAAAGGRFLVSDLQAERRRLFGADYQDNGAVAGFVTVAVAKGLKLSTAPY